MKQLVFLHIPKTGGRTMIHICRRFYQDHQCQEVGRFPSGKHSLDFIYGHFPYRASLRNERYKVFTLLREPAYRLASYYQMVLRHRPDEWSHYHLFWQDDKPMHILDFAQDEFLQSGMLRNAMVRQLVGARLFRQKRRVNEGDLIEAIRNLKTLMVGFQENYEVFLGNLCQSMHWDKPVYKKQNQSLPYQISESILEDLREINQYDVLLYKWAKENLSA